MSIAEASSTAKTITTEDLCALPDDDIDRELIRGELREKPAVTRRNRYHGRTETRVAHLLEAWLERQSSPSGIVVSGEAGFRVCRDPETSVGIDVAYVSSAVVEATPPKSPFFEGPPVLAVEILSPSDQHGDVVDKVNVYLEAGTVVWIVDPYFQTVAVHRQGREPEAYNRNHDLTADAYLPGFHAKVAEFFA